MITSAQVGGDRRLPGDAGRQTLLLDLPVELVDLGVPRDHRLGGLAVGGEQRAVALRIAARTASAIVHQQSADLVQVGLELLAHRHVLGSVCRRPDGAAYGVGRCGPTVGGRDGRTVNRVNDAGPGE